MYSFMTLPDETEIVHSEMMPDGKVKVYMETPDEKYCFKHATCWLPEQKWEDILGYINNEYLRDGVSEIISFDTWSDTERLILENVLENIVG